MTELKPEAFNTVVDVPCFEADSKLVGDVLKHVRKQLLKLPNFKPVREASDSTKKLFLLDPCKVRGYEDLTEEARRALSACGVSELARQDVSLCYENWTAEEVLRAVLGQPDAAGFSIVGHILHLNLREHLNPYKGLIGKVYLDKVKNVTCVVNKVNVIESTFRNFSMEVLAGERNTQVEVKQNGLRFQFDFAEVYWNPRLSTEHSRVVSLLDRGDILYDVFAGVGPFAVPAARKGCVVFANDLNPRSFSWLKHNVDLNKVSDRVSTYNLDGREFIRTVLGCNLREHVEKELKVHVCMNLPSLATEFLDAFVGLLDNKLASRYRSEEAASKDVPKNFLAELSENLPKDVQHPQRDATTKPIVVVHCYCFAKEEDRFGEARKKVEEGLGLPINAEVRLVRSVAPNKDMMRVTFNVPPEVLLGGSPPTKRCRLEESVGCGSRE